MDKMMASLNPEAEDAQARARAELATIEGVCRWTEGHWEAPGGAAWNDLQNVPKHTRMLPGRLIRAYVRGRRRRAA